MLFNSLDFLGFFAIVFPVYWCLPRNGWRTIFLILVSVWFYAHWNSFLALVLSVTTLLDFLIARRMDTHSEESHRKFLLIVSLAMNLGLLFLFKYLNFFGQSLNALAIWAGFPLQVPDLSMPNPIGISFYTFEAISYTVDVYRRKVRAVSRFEPLLLFITFFPHVVAGPIVRARAFLPQIERWKRWSWTRCQLGLTYISMGLFKKAALADRLAQIADPIFQSPQNFSSLAVAAGVLAYSIQVYCDFSGYTDIAIGLAHLLGFRLAPNFNMPYASANVSEFWRRWHISLSSWLRDYVYIPLGGNSGGTWRVYRNLMLTMLLGGLWHGASWNFVLWGGLHGAFLCIHRSYRRNPWFHLPHALNVLLCFTCVTLAWVPFRSPSSATTAEIYSRLLSNQGGSSLPVAWSAFWVPMLLVWLAHLVGSRYQGARAYRQLPGWWLGLSMGVVAFLALIFAPAFSEPFIYFQF